jgi:hypothetical protein
MALTDEKQLEVTDSDPRLTVILPLPMKAELAAVAERDERSMGAVTRLALREFLARQAEGVNAGVGR